MRMRTLLTEERQFGDRTAVLKLRDVKGARKITVRVNHEGVVVTKPRWVARREVEDFLSRCRGWVCNELARWDELRSSSLIDRVLYLGQECEIRQASSPPVRLAAEVFWASGDTPGTRLKETMEWMRRRAKPVIREAVWRWARQMEAVPKRVTVRDQTSLWGSCSSRGTLSFNWRLVMAPPEVLEYIVVHELAHLREHNHSRRFWALVEAYCPEYESHERWLDEHNDRILSLGR